MLSKRFFILLALFSLGLIACQSTENKETIKKVSQKDYKVRVHGFRYFMSFNPLYAKTSSDREFLDLCFQALVRQDPYTLKSVPELAKQVGQVEKAEKGIKVTFEFKEGCIWDNGAPITAADYIFTLKLLKHPLFNSPYKPYLNSLTQVETYDNPKKFTIHLSADNIFAADIYGTFAILPAYHYDSLGFLQQMAMEDFIDSSSIKEIANNPEHALFAKEFKGNFMSSPQRVNGSGPYELLSYEDQVYVSLKKKNNWWGKEVISAKPDTIDFVFAKDPTAIVQMLKTEQFDVLGDLPPSIYEEISKNDLINKQYNIYESDHLAYRYIGLNKKHPILKDKNVRKAISHIVDKDAIINAIFSGLGTKTNGPVHQSKPYYNKNLPLIDFNLEKTKALLVESGWKDSDKDGILDKVIDGKKTDLILNLKIPFKRYVDLILIINESAEKIGMRFKPEVTEPKLFLSDLAQFNFEVYVAGWGQPSHLDDFRQTWHTAAQNNGTNYVGFGTAESDSIIAEIETCYDETRRNALYKRFQELVVEDYCYVFLLNPKKIIISNKRFKQQQTSIVRPGFFAKDYELAQD